MAFCQDDVSRLLVRCHRRCCVLSARVVSRSRGMPSPCACGPARRACFRRPIASNAMARVGGIRDYRRLVAGDDIVTAAAAWRFDVVACDQGTEERR